ERVAAKDLPAQLVVIFGASGDLTQRKLLPAFYHLHCEGLLPDGFTIVGYARTEMGSEGFVERARQSIAEHGRSAPEGERWAEFSRLLRYESGDFASEHDFDDLEALLAGVDRERGSAAGRFYYCATPPQAVPLIVDRIGESGMAENSRIVIEKPFGRDLESARELNRKLHEVFLEKQIFRIDHYLGKETVQNILALRFSNGMFEPIWNRRYVDNVQITVAEEIGVEGRGAFYDQTGALRDMVSTHLFQVLTFVAMEPPVSFEPERLRDEKVRVLRSMPLLRPERVVLGQYEGYWDERDVALDSGTETFAALQVEVDNWRWAGVPFNLRTGKRLERKVTEVSLSFRDVPYNVFRGSEAVPPGRDALTIRVQPNEGLDLHLNIKRPGFRMELDRAVLGFDYDEMYWRPLVEAYETLLLEVMEGDHTLFTREDEVERAWEVLGSVLDEPPPAIAYPPGSWGPDEAAELLLPHHWHVTPVRPGP
ncbi:MAG TPA: glucose-6-phosphate dehydrogenase, partial [Actinomycetota bacterium]|nr:glucose-6-phosphate dehydrogenase [Actinomycetota bacterium]